MEASSPAMFWCFQCSRLVKTCHGEAAACPRCGTPGSALEEIVDVVDAGKFLSCCHPTAHGEGGAGLPTVTVRGASATCAVCLDELAPGARAVDTPCKHVYHQGCLTQWLELNSTCPLCRRTTPDGAQDGLIVCDLQDGHFGLGRRIAGRVYKVRIVDKDGKLVNMGVARWITGACRRIKATAGALSRGRL